jgi:hypothetical protein
MKTFKQFLADGIIDVSRELSYVIAALKQLKDKIVDKDLDYDDIEEILNDDISLRAFGVSFDRSSRFADYFDSSNSMINVGLDGANYYPEHDVIVIKTLSHLPDVLSDRYTYDEFAQILVGTLKHEFIHRGQIAQRRIDYLDSDSESTREYLSKQEEISAYAGQAAHELLSTSGELPSKIVNRLKSSSNIGEMTAWSEAFYAYSNEFESNDPVYKKFIKYLVAYLEGDQKD